MTRTRQFLVPSVVTSLAFAGLGWMWRAAFASWADVRAERSDKSL